MSADNTEEKRAANDDMNIRRSENTAADKKSSSAHSETSRHSYSSHSSHRHHSSGSTRHSNSHSSSGKNRYRSSMISNKKKTTDIPGEYEKQKKVKLWWRSVFIAMVCGGLIWLVIMIFTTGQDGGEWNLSLKGSGNSNNAELQTELERLKAENMNLKYELDKYKKKYGEFGAEEEDDTEESSKPTASPKTKKK